MLCHSRHASQRGTRFFFYKLKIAPYHINVSTSYSTFILLNGLTMDELYIAYHFPSQQYVCLQECKHCFAIILRGGCSHNCPDSDSVNEDVSFLQYILSTIGEIIIDQESSSPVLRGGWYVLLLWTEVYILPAVNSVWWQNKSSQQLSLCGGRTKSFVFTITVLKKMVIMRARVVSSQTRFSPTMTLYFTMILGYCKSTVKKMADMSPGSKVLTPLNRLPVTRLWNWSTWANGDFPHHWPDIRNMGYVFDDT